MARPRPHFPENANPIKAGAHAPCAPFTFCKLFLFAAPCHPVTRHAPMNARAFRFCSEMSARWVSPRLTAPAKAFTLTEPNLKERS